MDEIKRRGSIEDEGNIKLVMEVEKIKIVKKGGRRRVRTGRNKKEGMCRKWRKKEGKIKVLLKVEEKEHKSGGGSRGIKNDKKR